MARMIELMVRWMDEGKSPDEVVRAFWHEGAEVVGEAFVRAEKQRERRMWLALEEGR